MISRICETYLEKFICSSFPTKQKGKNNSTTCWNDIGQELHPVEFHTLVKINELQLHTMTQLNLRKSTLGEKVQVPADYLPNKTIFKAQK